jgi:hypothetical protein
VCGSMRLPSRVRRETTGAPGWSTEHRSYYAVNQSTLQTPHGEAGKGDSTDAAPVGGVPRLTLHAMLGCSSEPEVIVVTSEALAAARQPLQDAGAPKAVREVIAGRIIAAASIDDLAGPGCRAALELSAGPA